MVVNPAPTAFTTPVAPTVATAVSSLIQEPPDDAVDSVIDAPVQIVDELPVIAAGIGLTVTTAVEIPDELL